jgi:hypothetical protein
MRNRNKQFAQRVLAAVVILAMLTLIGVPVGAMMVLGAAGYFVWRTVRRFDRQEVNRIFDFYVRANGILCSSEGHWYGFEIVEVIDRGEQVLRAMPDPPPLVYFALGWLYRVSDQHERAVEHLTCAEDETNQERHATSPSALLRRYVDTLRRLERNPAEASHTLAAIRSLERARSAQGAALLADSRARLKDQSSRPSASDLPETTAASADEEPEARPTPPPSITDVLRNVYEQDYEN